MIGEGPELRGTYLEKILAAKRQELRRSAPMPRDRELADLVARLPPPRDLRAALADPRDIAIIAEIKRSSPSEGAIRADADPRRVATAYALGGAAAISVLTDRHFDGTLDDLRAVRGEVSLPVLRKDFVLQRSQVLEARIAGADAVLLIVAALAPPRLGQLLDFTHSLGMQALCEAHDARELDRAMAAGARILGMNARDLHSFAVDPERVLRMRDHVPRTFVYVAESGVQTRDDVRRLRRAEVDAVLIGTALMRAPDPQAAVQDMRRVGP